MAWTLKDLDELKAAIAEGALSVQYQDRRVQYRSLEEMRSIRREMERELGLATGTGRRVRMSSRKGLG